MCSFLQICLSEPVIPVDEEALEKVWKGGVRGLARMHGHASQTVLHLCSSFVDSILELLLKKPLHPKEVLAHTASQLAQLVEIVTDCFSNIEGEDQRREVCSLLLSTLFSEHPHDSEEGGVSQLKDILALQHCGLESLADCVDPFHIGTDSSQNIPRSSMTELVGVGYWGIIEAFVLHQLSSIPSFDNLIACDESFYSLDLFLDMFILLSDVAYIAQHFPFTELGNALLQLTQDYTNTLAAMILNMSPSNGQKIHDHLRDRAVQVAAYKRAHRYWHTFSSALPSGYYKCVEAALPVCSTNDPLKDLDLSPLDEFSAKLLDEGLIEALKTQTISWLNLLYDFQMRHSERLLGDGSIDTCTISMIQDTLRIMKFRCAVLSCAPDLFSGKMWDQVMISMATWIHSAYESLCGKPVEDTTVRYSRKLCALTSELCKLFVSFYQVIAKLENGTIDLVDPERGSMKESLPREWQDVFAGECEHRVFVMWTDVVENLKPSEESPPIVALLNYLGGAIQISSTRFLQSSQDAEITFEPLLQLAPHYLLHNLFSVRLTAFYLLMKIVPSLVKHDAASFADISNAGDDGKNLINSEERLSLLKFENILSQAQTVVSTMLSDLKIGSSCTVQPLTDAYTYTTGYLLIWSIILKMCKEAETELMCQYAMWLKNSSENYAETFLLNVFRLLPQQAFDENVKRTLEFFSKDKDTEILFGACWTSAIVEHLACNALYGILSTLPALTRQWWTNAEPKSASLIDKVVSKHFSPHICEAEMSAVAKMQDKAVENMSVRVHTNVREVVATYTVDDLVMELVVRLPTNHPLSPMIVEIGKRNAAAAVQWRQWLMQLTMFLTHQNGTLWDGLALWRNNVVRKYEGVEECYICFCVLSGANFQLPKLSCRTCRKKFHSTCLYKWFQTSNKSTCPICRNLF
ncbi:hypothetical protein ONE63_001297 [Megalurothrips usitatus]|uniref:E3 ubiquitin-protein ligase listerin n=1 Tax=Megalurothrips usitatus TaxID=439358 RepID=A0AAV7XDQ1_9NEOP|nr:hypothetical protein ONE63_001297 [Megalurothrips usitatus]